MIKNPYLNAIVAGAYIVLIVLVISFMIPHEENKPDTIFIPMLMLSLLVLSVSIMGILFFYEPARLFLENKRVEALSFFFKTIGTFSIFVVILIIINSIVK
jgi:hypothetical protein